MQHAGLRWRRQPVRVGQRQRLLIARVLGAGQSDAGDCHGQPLATEATRILAAHRLSTLRRAARIYLIEKGRVVQEGRYGELVNEKGMFARLVSRQRLSR